MGIRIIKGGLLSTIQDGGRHGYQAYGFVVGGAMDSWAMKLANRIVKNDLNAAVVEMTMIGAIFEFDENTYISICGADMSPTINDIPVRNGKAIFVKKGDILSFKQAREGCRTYLAVSGGFNVAEVLHSKSTYLNANIGKRLESGDVLPIYQTSNIPNLKQRLSPSVFTYMNQTTIRYVEGRHAHWFSSELEGETYKINTQSNRMGYRLNGPILRTTVDDQVITEGTTFGTIQVPPNGQPIILMADRQPTGGYPKIGEVITVDLRILAQRKPGDEIEFKKVTLQEAQKIYREQAKTIQILEKMKG